MEVTMKSQLQEQLEITQARIKELNERFGDDELVRISSIASLERMEERLKKEITKSPIALEVFFKAFDRARKTPRPKVR